MRVNPTLAERRLWSMLRDRRMPVAKFRRQHVIAPYIVDFACLERSLIIEADGGQHADSKSDQQRDDYLRRRGFCVLRFWNNDVLGNVEGVMETIATAVRDAGPPPPTPPRLASHGGRGDESTVSDPSASRDPFGVKMP